MLRATRPASLIARQARLYSTKAEQTLGNEFTSERAATAAHAKQTTELWKKISFFVCIPACIVGGWWTYKLESDHEHHLEHIREENGGHLPAPPAYEYLNIRTKPFPWGMQSLFFNPEVNTPVGADEE